jgi:hypothetical protein
MRIVIVLAVVLSAAVIGAAVYFRSVALPADVWHVDPGTVTPPASPNFALLAGDGAPVIAADADVVAARLDAVARAEGAVPIGGAPGEGHVSYVARSRIMGFPDVISIRLAPVEGGTRLEVFSRARFGYSDMGVNAARVARWVAVARGA